MQQGKWAHRVVLLKERLQNQGIFCTLSFYWQRIRNMLFSRCVFGRGDNILQKGGRIYEESGY